MSCYSILVRKELHMSYHWKWEQELMVSCRSFHLSWGLGMGQRVSCMNFHWRQELMVNCKSFHLRLEQGLELKVSYMSCHWK